MFSRKSPSPPLPDLQLDLPSNLGADFCEQATQYNQGQQHVTKVLSPAASATPKWSGPSVPSVPTHVKEAAVSIALWGFLWVLLLSVGAGLEINPPEWSMMFPLGAVVLVSLFRPCGMGYWRTVAHALLGHYLAVLLV